MAGIGGLAFAAFRLAGVDPRQVPLSPGLRFWIIANDLFCRVTKKSVERDSNWGGDRIVAGRIDSHAFRGVWNCENTGRLPRFIHRNPD